MSKVKTFLSSSNGYVVGVVCAESVDVINVSRTASAK